MAKQLERDMAAYEQIRYTPIDLPGLIETGNLGREIAHYPRMVCADGYSMSVQASGSNYVIPRVWNGDKPGPFTHMEVGFPSARPEPWDQWQKYAEEDGDPTQTVYGYVPVWLIAYTLGIHGGYDHSDIPTDKVVNPNA